MSRTDGIAVVAPRLKFIPNVQKAEEHVYVTAFIAPAPVEALDKAVFDRPPRPDINLPPANGYASGSMARTFRRRRRSSKIHRASVGGEKRRGPDRIAVRRACLAFVRQGPVLPASRRARWIEFGRVGGKAMNLEAPTSPQTMLDGLVGVDSCFGPGQFCGSAWAKMLDMRPLRPQTFPGPVIMLILAVFIVSTVTLAGFAVILYALNHMVDGYEDESGFHHGAEPRRQGSLATAESVESFENIEGNWFEANRLEHQPRQASPRATSVGADGADNLPSCV